MCGVLACVYVSVYEENKMEENLTGSQVVHEKAPLVKSVVIAGPRGVGKKMLVQAVCTESGANMFDLTPANIAGKYPGKAGLNMLLHMVFKASHAHTTFLQHFKVI